VAERDLIQGEPGTTWKNDTPKVRYQFIANLANTCGACFPISPPNWAVVPDPTPQKL